MAAVSGCFTGNTMVLCRKDNGHTVYKRIDSLTLDDIIVSKFNRDVKICFIITFEDRESEVCLLSSTLGITAYHPVQKTSRIGRRSRWSEWMFPKDIVSPETMKTKLYNLILEDTHIIYCDGFRCVTFGHGYTDNEIVAHPYFGSDAIISDIANENTRQGGDGIQGYVNVSSLKEMRNAETGMVERYIFNE